MSLFPSSLSSSGPSGPKSAIYNKYDILEPKKIYFLGITFDDKNTGFISDISCPKKGVGGWSSLGLSTDPDYRPISMCLSDIFLPYLFIYNDSLYITNENTDSSHYDYNSTIIHEFLHALGSRHEHQNDLYSDGIVYDKTINELDNVNYDKITCPYGFDDCDYIGSNYDKDSIMHYSIGDIGDNNKLSNNDKEFLQKIYPIKENSDEYPMIYVSFVDNDKKSYFKGKFVEALITETFLPLIGVNFKFFDYYDGTGVPHEISKYTAKTISEGAKVIIDGKVSDYEQMSINLSPGISTFEKQKFIIQPFIIICIICIICITIWILYNIK